MKLRIRSKRRLLAAGCALLAGSVGALASLNPPAWVVRLDDLVYDGMVRRAADPEEAMPDIVLVAVDDASFEWVDRELGETWPWPREFHGVMAAMLARWGAKVVAFDFVFDQVHHGRLDDVFAFAEAIEEAGNVVLTAARDVNPPPPPPEPGRGISLRTYADEAALVRDAALLYAQQLSPFLAAGDDGIALYAGGYATDDDALARLVTRALVLQEFRRDLVVGQTHDREAYQAAIRDRLRGALVDLPESARRFDQRDAVVRRHALGRVDDPAFREAAFDPIADGIPPAAPFLVPARGLGFADQAPDADGLLRRVDLLTAWDGHVYPALPLAMALSTFGDPEDWPEVVVGRRRLRVGDRTVPLGRDGKALIRFHGARPYPVVPAWEVLDSAGRVMFDGESPAMDTSVFEGAIVIVAPAAAALMDFKPTPVSRLHLGPDVVAVATDNLLTNLWVRRVERGTEAAWSVLLAALAVFAAAWLGTFVSPARGKGVGGAVRFAARALLSLVGAALCVGSGLFVAWLAYTGAALWPGVAAPLVAASSGVALFLTGGELLERRDRRHIHDALGTYTSRAVADLVASEGVEALAPRHADVSVYFSDIASFTSFSEKMSPESLAELLNLYLTAMTDVILEHEGIVDKYIGDAIMAFWGAPAPQSDHALRAVRCALRMQRRLSEIAPDLEARYGVKLVVRAGVNSGQVAVGNMGSAQKVNYTLMGDTVNLAARLEGANKPYDTHLMVGEETWRQVFFAIVGRELDLLQVKGKDAPVRVFEPLAFQDELPDEWEAWIARYEEALGLYRARRFAEARAVFEEVISMRGGHDGPSAVYVSRCRFYEADPPPEDWDGVFVMTSK